MILQITKVRNLTNRTPARFNLLAGDLCYAQAQGDIQPIINPDGPNGKQPSSHNTPRPPAHSGGWDYYDPWIWSSWFPMIEPSASAIPWMFASGNHEPELFSSHVAADHVTVENYEPIGYGGLVKRLDLPQNGPSACPSVYSFTYGNVGIVSLDANDLSWEIQGLLGLQHGAQLRWLEALLVGLADQREHRLHRGLLPRVRLLQRQRPQLRRRRAGGAGRAVAEFQVDLAVQGHDHGRSGPTAAVRPLAVARPRERAGGEGRPRSRRGLAGPDGTLRDADAGRRYG